eukprot:3017130-Rhodomonas_salina.4
MSPLDAIVGIPDYGALNEASELWVRSFVWLDFRLAGIVPFLVRVPIMESDSRNSGGSGILCRQSAGAARFQDHVGILAGSTHYFVLRNRDAMSGTEIDSVSPRPPRCFSSLACSTSANSQSLPPQESSCVGPSCKHGY